ncbi:MAG: type II toxin-antitoxin system RelE/ParE family toxin [Gallionellaceae bacterium]|nr:type II toxin-antitoxin system RelE/ParE family toxin [Gallionellaceae bacterium]
MRLAWTDEALDDLADILVYYLEKAGPVTTDKVEARIVNQIEALRAFPESIRNSERIPGTRELVIQRLPYIAFVQVLPDQIRVLNIVHSARRFP